MKPSTTRKCSGCGKPIYSDNQSGLCAVCRYSNPAQAYATPPTPAPSPTEQLAWDRERKDWMEKVQALKRQYGAALKTIEQQDTELGWLRQIREGVATTAIIEPKVSGSGNEAVPVIVASDWHHEEIVKPAQVQGLNEHNLEISDRRITRFFQSSLHLIKNHLNPGVTINTVVLALLGDFITNDIHDAENAENNALHPVQALLSVEAKIIAGINYFLNNSPYDFVIPCKVGNHSRTTKKVRAASETGHSLETIMYAHLASLFENEPRVRFVIDDGYHTTLNIYDKKVRFHHGHAIQYQGGIGGLFIPTYKKISQWDKAIKADLDVFGHFHQTKDGGKFLCNGSIIGYNAFAVKIGGDYEPPQQTLFVVDRKHGITSRWPIYVEKSW